MKKPFECKECNEFFDDRKKLKKHQACVHDKRKFYKCDFCDATFTRFNDLRLHQENNHNMNYKCTFCGMEFAQIHEVSKHIDIVHHGLQNTNWN